MVAACYTDSALSEDSDREIDILLGIVIDSPLEKHANLSFKGQTHGYNTCFLSEHLSDSYVAKSASENFQQTEY
jgi:hypothetical protein